MKKGIRKVVGPRWRCSIVFEFAHYLICPILRIYRIYTYPVNILNLRHENMIGLNMGIRVLYFHLSVWSVFIVYCTYVFCHRMYCSMCAVYCYIYCSVYCREKSTVDKRSYAAVFSCHHRIADRPDEVLSVTERKT